MLLDLLDEEGFAAKYDFVYLPIDFHRASNLGYAFINMVDREAAERVCEDLQDFDRWKLPTEKVCDMCWSKPLQGLSAHLERYCNSPVMHKDVPDMYKPIYLVDGKRAEFPEASKRLRPPRVKKGGADKTIAEPDAKPTAPEMPESA